MSSIDVMSSNEVILGTICDWEVGTAVTPIVGDADGPASFGLSISEGKKRHTLTTLLKSSLLTNCSLG